MITVPGEGHLHTMAPVRRAAPVTPPPPVQTGGSVNFGEDAFYTGGGFILPAGEYALEFNTQMYQPMKADNTPARAAFLAVAITAYPLAGGAPLEPHYVSCGTKAHLSFVPSIDGKGFESVPGGPAVNMNNMTNWALLFKSLRDCGMPADALQNDFSTIDGIWVRTDNQDEPEDRKKLKAQTAEADQQNRGPNKVPVVMEIMDGGKPWEGSGGFEVNGVPLGTEAGTGWVTAAAAPAAVAPAPRTAPGPRGVVARTAAAPVATAPIATRRVAPARAAAAPPAVVGEVVDDAAIADAALQGCTTHLEKAQNANGCTKLMLRNGTFAAVKAAAGDDMAQAVLNTYFASDEALNVILGQLGYTSKGGQIAVVG